MLSKPKEHNAVVKDTKWISSKVLELTFETVEKVDFTPGQYINIEVTDNTYRSYSISSDPSNNKEIKIIAAVKHEGVGANFLKSLKTGDDVKFIGPSGKFFLRDGKDVKNIVFVATGTGLAPFISMLHALKHSRIPAKMQLFFGVRKEDEVFYLDLLDSFKESLDLDYTIYVSQDNNGKYNEGRVTEHFKIHDVKNAHVYLCGHPNMIDEMITILENMDVSKERVFYEKYTKSIK